MLLTPGGPLVFPDPNLADDEGLLAVGGDLSPQRLLYAYRCGVFPWYDAGVPPLWWSPNPRAILPRESLHVSRSLRRKLRQARFELSFDRAFDDVMRQCGRLRPEGTWILPEMVAAYGELHRLGHAHSFEVWKDGELCGGLYGVQVGGLFAAESMFHRRTDASKVALAAAVTSLHAAGIELFDVQFSTRHLESMGAVEWPRRRYIEHLAAVCDKSVPLGGLDPAHWIKLVL